MDTKPKSHGIFLELRPTGEFPSGAFSLGPESRLVQSPAALSREKISGTHSASRPNAGGGSSRPCNVLGLGQMVQQRSVGSLVLEHQLLRELAALHQGIGTERFDG